MSGEGAEPVFQPISAKEAAAFPHSSSLPATFQHAGNLSALDQAEEKHHAHTLPRHDVEPSLCASLSDSNSETGCMGHPVKKKTFIQRLFCFVTEVWPAPSSSAFGNTKVLTVKNKIQILNETGFSIEYKQHGTPDPSGEMSRRYGSSLRLGAGTINPSSRVGLHWDNANLKQEIVIRPADGEGGQWHWSGKFELPDKETYLGIKIRRKDRSDIKIIPVNITVGASGCILVTLKSDQSLPPYMVLNRCRDVVVCLRQKAPEFPEDEVKMIANSLAKSNTEEGGTINALNILQVR
jgi:hypothetical protein